MQKLHSTQLNRITNDSEEFGQDFGDYSGPLSQHLQAMRPEEKGRQVGPAMRGIPTYNQGVPLLNNVLLNGFFKINFICFL